jgi:hypothetical protein
MLANDSQPHTAFDPCKKPLIYSECIGRPVRIRCRRQPVPAVKHGKRAADLQSSPCAPTE